MEEQELLLLPIMWHPPDEMIPNHSFPIKLHNCLGENLINCRNAPCFASCWQGQSRGGSSSSPGNVTKSRLVGYHAVHSVVKILHFLFGLGKEELKGEHHLVALQPILDPVADLHGDRINNSYVRSHAHNLNPT